MDRRRALAGLDLLCMGESTSAKPKFSVDTSVGWKGTRVALAACTARCRREGAGNRARSSCIEAAEIV